MGENTRILIPLDGSSNGDAIMVAIHPLLRSGRVESTLLHVTESPGSGDAVRARLEMHQRALEQKGIRARVLIVTGRPAGEILRQADLGSCDLVAMTTHGRTGMDRVLMGSVAEEVVRSSSVPTLLFRSGARMGEWERIVVALDGTPGAEEVLDDAVRLARASMAQLHLLQVGLGLLRCDGYRGVGFHSPGQDSCAYLERVATRLMTQGVSVTQHWREGMAAPEIAAFARHLDAGLICMTTEGRPEKVPGLDRSVAAEVIRAAPCPVYVRKMSRAAAKV